MKISSWNRQLFYKNTKKPEGCWDWIGRGGKSKSYPRTSINMIPMLAHRASWIIHFGDIPNGLHVLHRCDNRRCVNPDHLFLGTHQDNMKDRDLKGRNRVAKGSKNGSARLTEKDVSEIRRRYVPWVCGVYQLAREFGVVPSTIHAIVQKRTWIGVV